MVPDELRLAPIDQTDPNGYISEEQSTGKFGTAICRIRSNRGINELAELKSKGELGSLPSKIRNWQISAVNCLESLWEGSKVAGVPVSGIPSVMVALV